MPQSHAIYPGGVQRRLRLRLLGGTLLGVHDELNDLDQNLGDHVRTESISDMGHRSGGAHDLRNSDDTCDGWTLPWVLSPSSQLGCAVCSFVG